MICGDIMNHAGLAEKRRRRTLSTVDEEGKDRRNSFSEKSPRRFFRGPRGAD